MARPLVDWVNRRPSDEATTEAQNRVHATCVRGLLDDLLSRANDPIREIEALSDSEAEVEFAAKLVPTTADADELDHAVAELEASPLTARPPGLSEAEPERCRSAALSAILKL